MSAYTVTMNCAQAICDLYPDADTPETRDYFTTSIIGVLIAYLVVVMDVCRETALNISSSYYEFLSISYKPATCDSLLEFLWDVAASAAQKMHDRLTAPGANPMLDLCKIFYEEANLDFDVVSGLSIAALITQYTQDVHPYIKRGDERQSAKSSREKRLAIICICVSVVVLIVAVCVTFSV